MQDVPTEDAQKGRSFGHKLVVRPSKTARFLQSYGSPTILDWKDIVEDYLDLTRKRQSSKFAMFRLQTNMFLDIMNVHHLSSNYDGLIKNPAETLKNEFGTAPDTTEKDLKFWERERDVYSHIEDVLRDLGDGILWRTLGYNRALIQIMSVSPRVSVPNVDEGLISELNALGDIVNDETISRFVFHAITEVGRIGDITTTDEDGYTEILEIKTKGQPRGKQWKERMSRQVERRSNLVNIANDGQGMVAGKEIELREIQTAPKLFMQSFRSLISDVRIRGWSSIKPYSYLGLLATDSTKLEDVLGVVQEQEEKLTNSLAKTNTDLVRYLSLDSLRFFSARTPFSIYPLPPADIANILMGRVLVKYFFNFSTFYLEMERLGWKVSDKLQDNLANPEFDKNFFCTVSKKDFHTRLPGTLISRIIFEGLAPISIIEMCENGMRFGKKTGEEFIFLNYKNEPLLWN